MTAETGATTERRAPLSRERVLAAAVDLADREGIDALSMRRLGTELGVEAMSLYNHVANKEDVLDGMVDVILGEIDSAPEAGEWKARLRGRILSARRAMLRHPWASGVIVSRSQASPAMMSYMDGVAGIFLQGGFSVDLLHHAMHVLGSRVLGFSQELFDDSNELVQSPEMKALMLQQMSAAYPNITEIVRQVQHDEASVVGAGCDDQLEFEFALDLLLDGLERRRASETTAGG
ncbi:MAG TPA: TetR/AcrR family transcriptional regulator C-terminal domain-containing protein [Candidatus Limnocylindrales bacterium]|nr:TetR/AcrR family transcriptional regulator C-terminal domain-containing protein [Candidatus Limnocylindrales bacterium]